MCDLSVVTLCHTATVSCLKGVPMTVFLPAFESRLLSDVCEAVESKSLVSHPLTGVDWQQAVYANKVGVPFDGVLAWEFRQATDDPPPQKGRKSAYVLPVSEGTLLVGVASLSVAVYDSRRVVYLLDQGDELHDVSQRVSVFRPRPEFYARVGDNHFAFAALVTAGLAKERQMRSKGSRLAIRYPSQAKVRFPVEYSPTLVRGLWLEYQAKLSRMCGMYGASVFMGEYAKQLMAQQDLLWSELDKITG